MGPFFCVQSDSSMTPVKAIISNDYELLSPDADFAEPLLQEEVLEVPPEEISAETSEVPPEVDTVISVQSDPGNMMISGFFPGVIIFMLTLVVLVCSLTTLVKASGSNASSGS